MAKRWSSHKGFGLGSQGVRHLWKYQSNPVKRGLDRIERFYAAHKDFFPQDFDVSQCSELSQVNTWFRRVTSALQKGVRFLRSRAQSKAFALHSPNTISFFLPNGNSEEIIPLLDSPKPPKPTQEGFAIVVQFERLSTFFPATYAEFLTEFN